MMMPQLLASFIRDIEAALLCSGKLPGGWIVRFQGSWVDFPSFWPLAPGQEPAA